MGGIYIAEIFIDNQFRKSDNMIQRCPKFMAHVC